MARELGDARSQLEPALPRREADRRCCRGQCHGRIGWHGWHGGRVNRSRAFRVKRSSANGIVTFRISRAISRGWIGRSSRFWFGGGGFERGQGQFWILGGRAVRVRGG